MNEIEFLTEFKVILDKIELESLSFMEDGHEEYVVKVDENLINPLISETEYISNIKGFLDKLKKRLPLLRKSSEEKKNITKDDFIYYE